MPPWELLIIGSNRAASGRETRLGGTGAGREGIYVALDGYTVLRAGGKDTVGGPGLDGKLGSESSKFADIGLASSD
jgi:hypothetical protein